MTGLSLVLVVFFRHHPRTQLGLIKIIVVNVNVVIFFIVIIILIIIFIIISNWSYLPANTIRYLNVSTRHSTSTKL